MDYKRLSFWRIVVISVIAYILIYVIPSYLFVHLETLEVEKQTTKEVKEVFYQVRKLIKNPMKLSLSIVLKDFKPYILTKAQLEDEIFMEHIEKLIKLKKIESV